MLFYINILSFHQFIVFIFSLPSSMFTKRASKFKQRQRPRPKSDDSGESSEENVEINRQIRRRRNDPNKQTSKKVYYLYAMPGPDLDKKKRVIINHDNTAGSAHLLLFPSGKTKINVKYIFKLVYYLDKTINCNK